MATLLTFTFLALIILVTRQEESILKNPDYIDKIVGIKDLQIGYGTDCYFFSDSTFRCNEDKGDPMEIVLAERPLE